MDEDDVGRIVVGRLRRANEDVLISINGHADFAAEWYCGVHCGGDGQSVAEARMVEGINGPVGYSAHDLGEARAAFDAGTDYVFFSPIFPTASSCGAISTRGPTPAAARVAPSTSSAG